MGLALLIAFFAVLMIAILAAVVRFALRQKQQPPVEQYLESKGDQKRKAALQNSERKLMQLSE